MRIVVYAPNLMDQSRIRAQFTDVSFVSSPVELKSSQADVIMIDLSDDSVLDVLPDLAEKNTIGFGSHVDVQRMQRAVNEGCRTAVPRSRFFARMTEIVNEITK